MRVVSAALAMASFVAVGVASATTTSTTSSTTTTTSRPTTTTAPSNLACATKTVAAWSLVHQANETVSVSVNALDIGAMGPAATAGYGGILLFGTTAPAKFSSIVATLQRETPG